jgi:hypothetical protein
VLFQLARPLDSLRPAGRLRGVDRRHDRRQLRADLARPTPRRRPRADPSPAGANARRWATNQARSVSSDSADPLSELTVPVRPRRRRTRRIGAPGGGSDPLGGPRREGPGGRVSAGPDRG